MPRMPKVPASFQSRMLPVCVRVAALVTDRIITTKEFATSTASLEGSPSDTTSLSLLAKKQPRLSKTWHYEHAIRLPIRRRSLRQLPKVL